LWLASALPGFLHACWLLLLLLLLVQLLLIC
jgi:hypothetical protein